MHMHVCLDTKWCYKLIKQQEIFNYAYIKFTSWKSLLKIFKSCISSVAKSYIKKISLYLFTQLWQSSGDM